MLFLGVALMAGGLAGSLVRMIRFRIPLRRALIATATRNGKAERLTGKTVLILKYIIPQYDGYIYYGGANVGMNAGIMISCVLRPCGHTGVNMPLVMQQS